jgi:hypothetical protein
MKFTLPFTSPARVCVERCAHLAMPKSSSFTSPRAEASTFIGDTSRWTIPSGRP